MPDNTNNADENRVAETETSESNREYVATATFDSEAITDQTTMEVTYDVSIGSTDEHTDRIQDIELRDEEEVTHEFSNGDIVALQHEDIEITEVDENPVMEDPYVHIRYTGDLHTIIPIRYFSRNGDDLDVQTHYVPTTAFAEQRGTNSEREFRFRHENIFVEHNFDLNDREEALDNLSGEAMPDEVEDDISEEISDYIGEQIREVTEDSSYSGNPRATAEAMEEDEEMAGDDAMIIESDETVTTDDVVEAAESVEEHSHSMERLATTDEMREQLRRDMDGRYNYADNREDELRELAADIETRIDHLLRKRQRIKEKLDEMMQNE